MLEIPLIYIKDKQAFQKTGGALKILGNAVEVARRFSEKYKLIHIVDLELEKGITTNFDIYDKLTYFINIQVECDDEKIIKHLLGLKARVVIKLPTELPSEKWNKRLLVGMVEDSEDAGAVHDVILKNPTKDKIKKYEKQGKRIILFQEKWDKKTEVWAVILQEF